MSDIIVTDQAIVAASSDGPKNRIRDWLGILSGLGLAFLTAALFCVGRANRAGYLYQLGLDLSQIPDDFYVTLYWGYFSGAPDTIIWLAAGAIMLLGTAIIVLCGDFAWTRAVRRWPRLRKLNSLFARPSTVPSGTDVKLFSLAMLTIVILALVVLTYLTTFLAHRAGAENGKRLIAALATNVLAAAAKYDLQWIEISIDLSPQRVVRGYRLICTEQLCSIYDPMPQNRGIRLVSLKEMTEIRIGQPKDEK